MPANPAFTPSSPPSAPPSATPPFTPPTTAPLSLHHRLHEDAQALFAGTLFVAMALMLFQQAGLLSGGTAGVAFLLHYATGITFGKAFFLLNLPFYWFAWTRMGREFTLKTFFSVALLSALTELFPHVLHVDHVNPLFAAVLGGLLMGTGCLFLARHRSSLGGATIVSLYVQSRSRIRAGQVQMAIDCSVLALAVFAVPLERVAYSVLAAVVMGVFLWVNHRPGRYTGG